MSLLDMLELNGVAFYNATRMLQFVVGIVERQDEATQEQAVGKGIKNSISKSINGLEVACSAMGTNVTKKSVNRLQKQLKDDGCTWSIVSKHLVEIGGRLRDELESVKLFALNPQRAPYYYNKRLFGNDVAAAYPNASDHIEAAGKCVALEQGTAAVFHLMGVMELGLRSLGHSLGIPYAPSWESYIRQINAKMAIDYAKKPDDWKKDEAFYRDLLGDLIAVKNSWRNPTIHVQRKYLPDESEEVFRAVRAFMKRAATKLCEASGALPLPSVSAASDGQPS